MDSSAGLWRKPQTCCDAATIVAMNLPLNPAPAVDLGLRWVHRFAALGAQFHTEVQPAPLPGVHWVGTNAALATELGLGADFFHRPGVLEAFSGGVPIAGALSLASVYSGHQFGVWAGQLGDGRAILLGGIETPAGEVELQLKGAGMTPYSRRADGRAVLRSTIREYLCSEAMHGLGIPTTRALCAAGSPAPVYREDVETAAVVTRVAPSFIRFGHFEHFASLGRHDDLRVLADAVIDGFFPEVVAAGHAASDPQRYATFLGAVCGRTAELIAQWQAVGFCHGVMNTDNMSILGLTIDYGPFQFLDGYDPGHICNHSDHSGRYACDRQPQIGFWNLACLAQALMPLIGEQQPALDALAVYKQQFPRAQLAGFFDKLGLPDTPASRNAQATAMLNDLLQLMAGTRVDFTIAWDRLTRLAEGADAQPWIDLFLDRRAAQDWLARLDAHLQACPRSADDLVQMRRANPRIVLRNHLAEVAIRRARAGDFAEVQRLLLALQQPHAARDDDHDLMDFPPAWASTLEISCSS